MPFLIRHPSPLLASCLLLTLALSSCTSPTARPSSGPATLGKLMVKRLNWMDEVAAVKQARSLPINDPKREAELLQAMEKRGADSGLPAPVIRSFFVGQITAAKVLQEEWLKTHPASAARVKKLPDLAKTVRPALDQIGVQMISALTEARRLNEPGPIVNAAQQRLTRAGYSPEVIEPAIQGLEEALAKPKAGN